MGLRSGTRLVVGVVGACVLVVLAAASASAAKPQLAGRQAVSLGQSAAAAAGASRGVEAALPANAAGGGQVSIASISCPSAGDCAAVGSYVDSSGNTEGLLLTEKAGTWLGGVEAVLPADAAAPHQYASVGDVSCPSAGNCSAVGMYVDSSFKVEVLLLTETAGTWAPGQKAVLPANFDANQVTLVGSSPYPVLSSVSCGSAGNCVAVGRYPVYPDSSFDTQGLLLTETEGTWSAGMEAALPANADTQEQLAGLGSVSCASAGNCTAVGSYSTTSGFEGLLLTETAGNWTSGEAVLPADAVPASPDASLGSVSCASAGNCTALGSYHGSSSSVDGLLLSETDGTWSTGVKASLPANATTTGPTGIGGGLSVSCASAGNCTAVSNYVDNADHTQGLLLTETAGTWAAGQEAVLPADATASMDGVRLRSVSCASAGNCTAVGSYDVGSLAEPMLLTETAGSWTSGARVSLPANAQAWKPGSLTSVSCAPAGGCSAVGYYYNSFGSEGLLTGGNPALVKLEISRGGRGSGKVSSRPAGIHCGSTCSAAFDAGTSLRLIATPSAGSRFSGWTGGGCPRRVSFCDVDTSISDQTVKATFSLLPKCAVPRVKGKTLKAAKRAIRNRDCRVGKIEYATSQTTRRGHVISQRPKSGRRLKHGARVNLVMSKGRL